MPDFIDKQIIHKFGYRVTYRYHKLPSEEEKVSTQEIKDILAKSLLRNAYEQKTKR